MTYEEKLKMKLTKIKALAERGSENESIIAQNLLKKLTEIFGVDLNFATEEIYTFDFPYKNEYEKELLTWLFYKVIGVQSYNIYRDARIKKLCLKTTQLEYDEIMFLFNFYKYKLDEELKKFTIAFLYHKILYQMKQHAVTNLLKNKLRVIYLQTFLKQKRNLKKKRE